MTIPPDQVALEKAWIALAELFVDTDGSDRIAGILAELRNLPFDAMMLDDILFRDVYPVFIHNLRQVAGVWQDFDHVSLIAAIYAHRSRQQFGIKARLGFRRWQARRIIPDWQEIRAQLA